MFYFGEKSSPNYSKQVKKDSILPEGHLSIGGKSLLSPSLNSTLNIIQAESYSKLLAPHQSRASVCLASSPSAPFPLFPPSLEVSEQRGRKGAREGGDQEGFVCCNLMGPAPQTALLWKVNSDYDAWWVLSMRLNKTTETQWGKTFLSEKT